MPTPSQSPVGCLDAQTVNMAHLDPLVWQESLDL